MSLNDRLRELLKEAKEEFGLQQLQVAKLIGCTPEHLSAAAHDRKDAGPVLVNGLEARLQVLRLINDKSRTRDNPLLKPIIGELAGFKPEELPEIIKGS